MSDGDYRPYPGLDPFLEEHLPGVAIKVVTRFRPLIEGMMDDGDVHRQALFLHVGLACPELGFPWFTTVYTASFGRQPITSWEYPYNGIARGKNRISGRTGQLSRVIRVARPLELVDGDTEFWGNWKFGRILVANSGVKPWFDMAFSSSIGSLMVAELEQILFTVYGMTAEEAGLVTYDGTTLTIFETRSLAERIIATETGPDDFDDLGWSRGFGFWKWLKSLLTRTRN